MKRLTLNRETLRSLDPQQMTDAAGGASAGICPLTQSCFVSYCNCPPTTTVTQKTCPSLCAQTYC